MVGILSHIGKKAKLKKVYYFTEDQSEKKEIKNPFENSISIFDEMKNF